MTYDCIIVGGGIAGLQAAIQLGRYEHAVLVIDANGGRSTLCKDYHNILGWPDGISGEELRKSGQMHAEKYGVQFLVQKVSSVKKEKDHFIVYYDNNNEKAQARRLLFATGITENLPILTGIKECLGKSIYLCPDCDGYEIKGEKTAIIGSGNKASQLASILTYWSNRLFIINHSQKPMSQKSLTILKEKGIPVFDTTVKSLQIENESQLTGILLEDGQFIEVKKAFLAMEGAQVNSDLAKSLGVERLENNHILVNPRTKETSVPHVWAVGDVTVHSQLLTIAMGDGAQAAIWIHKSLLQ